MISILKNTLNKYYRPQNFLNCTFATLLSLVACLFFYKYFVPSLGYTGLSDFYIGSTIYSNCNKNIEGILPSMFLFLSYNFNALLNFLNWTHYLPLKLKSLMKIADWFSKKVYPSPQIVLVANLFFTLLISLSVGLLLSYLISLIRPPDFLNLFRFLPLVISVSVLIVCWRKNFVFDCIAARLQWLGPFSYFYLYPNFTNNTGVLSTAYLKLLILITILLSYGSAIYTNVKKNKTYSVIAFAPLFLGLFYQTYTLGELSKDNYHFAEQLVTFWNHHALGYKLYFDVFPPHGLRDIVPGYLGLFFFGDSTASSHVLGSILLQNFFLAVTLIAVSKLFSLRSALLILLIVAPMTRVDLLLAFTLFLLIIKNSMRINNWLIPICFYVVFCLFFYLYEPAFGAPLILATALPIIWIFFKNLKKLKAGAINMCTCIITLAVLVGLFLFYKDFFINNFKFILANYDSNLPAFGNNGDFSFNRILGKCSQYLLAPVFLFLLTSHSTSFKNIQLKNNFFIFCLLYPIFIASYSLGRLDGSNLPRAAVISSLYLGLLIPFGLIYVLPVLLNRRDTILLLLFSVTLLNGNFLHDLHIRSKKLFTEIPIGITYSKENTIYGAVKLPAITLELVNKIQSAFQKYQVPTNSAFLDLTNRGTLYYFLQKPQPTPFLSYYNVGNPEFDRQIWKLLALKKPDFILLGVNEEKFASLRHDDLPISLRINKVYKELLTDKSYSFHDEDDLIFLVKDQRLTLPTPVDLTKYDDKIGIKKIAMLPDAWGSSSQALHSKMTQIEIDFFLTPEEHQLQINLEPGKSLKDFDLLMFDNAEFGIENYELKLNSPCSKSVLTFQSRTEIKLIPLDTIPSWLNCAEITSLSISWRGSKKVTKSSITFFKRL